MNAAAFLDRDNTIIRNDGDLGDPAKVELIQGAAAAIASLCGLGYRIIVVTNQGGVARGKYTEEDVNKVNNRIAELVDQKANGANIDAFYYCPYHPEGTVEKYKREHEDRKPQPGMLLTAAADFDIDLAQSWMIGDQMRDVEAGLAAGCRTILLKSDASRLTPLHADEQSRQFHRNREQHDAPVTPEYYAPSLIEAVRIIAQQRRPDFGESGATSRLPQERRWDAAAVARLQQQKPRSAAGEIEPVRAKVSQPPAPPEAALPAPEASQPSKPAETAPASAPDEKQASQPNQRDNVYRPKGPVKPFRPPGSPDPSRQDAVVLKKRQPAGPEPAAAKPAAEKTPQAEPADKPVEPEPASQPSSDATQAQPTQPAASKPTPILESPETNRLLQQVVSELRRQRGVGTEFSWMTILAIVLQGIAALCLVAGLWMGAAQPDLLFKWMFSGMIVQGATIAMLLMARHFD